MAETNTEVLEKNENGTITVTAVEKPGLMAKIGGGIKKAAASKPVRIVTGVVVAAACAAGGYLVGKASSIDDETWDDFEEVDDEDTDYDVVDAESSSEE